MSKRIEPLPVNGLEIVILAAVCIGFGIFLGKVVL